MSILIKGMEMPQEGKIIVIDCTGQVWSNEWPTRGYTRLKNAKAINIPPHGRLIDADRFEDDLIKEKTRLVHLSDYRRDFNYMEQAFGVNNAILLSEAQQTIIEAEEEENE